MNTTVPIANILSSIYGLNPQTVNLSGLLYFLMHPLFTFPAAYVIDRHGTRVAILLGAALSLAGAATRLLINSHFAFVLLGQVVGGIGRPFIINCQAKISSNWYHASKRTAVTSFFALVLNISIILGVILPGLLFAHYRFDPADVAAGRRLAGWLMQLEFYIVLGLLVPNLLLTRDKPPTAPAEQLDPPAQSFPRLVASLVADPDYRLLFGAYMLYFGAFNAIANNMSFLLQPFFGKNTLVTTLAGSTPILSGVLGVMLFTGLQRRENRMRKYILACMVGTFACVILFLFSLLTKSVVLVCLNSMANSFFLIPLIPIMLELGCELAYPVGEGAAVGFMIAGGNLGGFLIGFVMSLYVKGESVEQTVAGLATVLCVFIVGFGLVVLCKENKKRQRAERDNYIERKSFNASLNSDPSDVYQRPTYLTSVND